MNDLPTELQEQVVQSLSGSIYDRVDSLFAISATNRHFYTLAYPILKKALQEVSASIVQPPWMSNTSSTDQNLLGRRLSDNHHLSLYVHTIRDLPKRFRGWACRLEAPTRPWSVTRESFNDNDKTPTPWEKCRGTVLGRLFGSKGNLEIPGLNDGGLMHDDTVYEVTISMCLHLRAFCPDITLRYSEEKHAMITSTVEIDRQAEQGRASEIASQSQDEQGGYEVESDSVQVAG